MLENNNWLGEIFEKLGLDIHKLGVQFLYDPNNPMLFNSGFLFIGAYICLYIRFFYRQTFASYRTKSITQMVSYIKPYC